MSGVHPPYPVIVARRIFRRAKRHVALTLARGRRTVSALRARSTTRYRPALIETTPWTWPNLIALALFAGFVSLMFLDWNVRILTRSQPHEIWRFFDFLTQFGKSDWILVPTGIAVLLGVLINWKAIEPRTKAALARVMSDSGMIFSAVATAGIVVLILKAIFGRARPKHMDELGVMDFSFMTLQAGYPSFPSGHSATAAALAVALACLVPKWRWVFASLAVWLGGSRVVVGAHYPSDVVFGFLIGGAVSWTICQAYARRRWSLLVDEDQRLRPKPSQGMYRLALRSSLRFAGRLLQPKA